ncbi:uncharacterized protein stbd1 [Sebastes fasciatus]|uniref:uncharacterized protein stbd1 n=1 Tax=Sebastes fasciatus TaxID=394691 RepID=UPI003D9F2CC1
MPLKNGNTVGVERRMDLASLFCMIGRHGPAVALAVIAMMSVLAGFIIYRTVRGKRRKKATEEQAAADGDGDGGSTGEEERDAPVESTDVSDEGSSEVNKDVDLLQSDLKIRHRRAAAAAEKTPPRYSPPKRNNRVQNNKDPTSDDSYEGAETYAEKANQSLQSDTCTEAEMVLEDAVDCHRGETDDAVKDVLEEFHANDGCLKEPEPINDEKHEEAEKVFKAECQEEEDVTTDEDVSDKTTREEEDNFQCALNNPVCFEQTPHMNENSDDRLQDVKTTNHMESNSEEPVIHVEDVSLPCVCYGKDEEFEEDDPDSIDYSSFSASKPLSPEEEKKNESEEACFDHQLIGQQAKIWSSTSEQETDMTSTQQEQCDHVTDKVTTPIRVSDWDEDGGLAGEEDLDEDHLNKLTAVKFDSPQFDEQDVAIEQREENGLRCDQDDGVLYDGADQVKVKMLSGDNIVVCSEEHDSSSVALSPALSCALSAPVKADNHDDSLSGISGIADFADLTLHCQNPQKEDKTDPSLHEDTDFTILGPEMPSHETENQPENNGNGTTDVLADELNDQVCDPCEPCYKDQQSAQTKRNEAFDKATVAAVPDVVACDGEYITTLIMAEVLDKASVAADPDTVENIPSVIVEEISFPHLTSMCQDQQIDHVEKNETFDEAKVNSATDATCNNASLTSPIMSEELSHPDMSSSQDQQSGQAEHIPDVTTGAAPVMIEDINPTMCQILLPSFEQFELWENDKSSAGVGEESGISSMTVSPDACDEFEVIFENMVLPVMECDLQSEGQTEAQHRLFADDTAISFINEDTAGMEFRPYPSHRSQPPNSQRTWANYESFAANEDMFGHEIEDSYHRAMDQLAAQIAHSVTSFSDELEKQSDVKVVVEAVEFKKKKAGVSVEKKDETQAEKEEDYEKTEISIMEATMDHNEWIMDSNYQALPWMNYSATSFAQDHTKTNQLPTEECQYSSAVTDTTCIGTTDISPSTEVEQTSTLSLVDESTENKKLVAVQPMPQNVNVTFRIHYFTQSSYQTVAVTGNQQELGNWKGFVPLERAKDGHWAVVVSLPTESLVEWKFVLVDKGEVCRWEECGNRLLDTGYGDDLLVHKWWGRL